MIPKFDGKVEHGQFMFYPGERDRRDNYLRSLEGKPVQVVYEQSIDKRTNKQNRYYWGVVLKEIATVTGNEINDLHEYFKLRFIPKAVVVEGDSTAIPGSTKKLSIEEFTEYIDKILVVAAEMGIQIPDSNGVVYE